MANITNFLNFSNISPLTGDYVVGFVNDAGVGGRGQFEYKATVKQLFDAFNTYSSSISGITPDKLSYGHPFWDTGSNFSVYNNLNVKANITILSAGNISTPNGYVSTQGSTNGIRVYDRNGSSSYASFYKVGGTNYFSDSNGGTIVTYTSAGNLYGNISANLSSTGGIALSTTNSITTIDGSQLLALINTLSSQMMEIGNYPYLEFAQVCAPNLSGFYVGPNSITTLPIDTVVASSSVVPSASLNSSTYRVTLPAGTYRYIARVGLDFSGAGGGSYFSFGLYNISTSQYVSRTGAAGGSGGSPGYTFARLEGQLTVTSGTSSFDIRGYTNSFFRVRNSGGDNIPGVTTSSADQRTTLQLWKVA